MAPLTCVAHILRRQFGLVTYAQLTQAGLSKEAVRHLVRTERLRRLYPGVFAAENVAPSPRQGALAAVLACGKGVALSHVSAACHWGLLRYWPSMPHVTKPGRSGAKGPKGIRLHHTLHPESTVHNHIPITTLARTLNDIAPTLRTPSLKAAVREAEIVHRLELSTLEPAPVLRRFLAEYASVLGATNLLEADFLELCATYDIPRPLTQHPVGPYHPDFLWPEYKLIVETDGRASHDTHISFSEDRVRLRFLQARGFEVLQFTYDEVTRHPERVASELRAALRRRRPLASPTA